MNQSAARRGIAGQNAATEQTGIASGRKGHMKRGCGQCLCRRPQFLRPGDELYLLQFGPGSEEKKELCAGRAWHKSSQLGGSHLAEVSPQADAAGLCLGWSEMVQPFLSVRQIGIYRQRQAIHVDGRLVAGDPVRTPVPGGRRWSRPAIAPRQKTGTFPPAGGRTF